MNFLAVGTGAGLVSALLIAVFTKGTALALLLYLLAPVPVLVASLGWNHRAGLVATAVGGLATALVDSPANGLGFALGTGLPAWWLAYLALLGRAAPDGTIEWYPLGRLLAWTAGTAAVTSLAASVIAAGGYDGFMGQARTVAEEFLRIQTGTPPGGTLPTIGGMPPETVVARFAEAVPVIGGLSFTLIFVLYLWLAARIVAISGRLPRPWPVLSEAAMPRAVIAVLIGAVLVANLAGLPGAFGLSLSGALTMAFALQGLAAIHDVTRGRAGRGFILGGVYLLVFMSRFMILVFLFFLGLADTAFGLRARMNRRAPPHLNP